MGVDSEYVKKIRNEFEADKGPQHYIVKLPCGHASVELTKPVEQFIVCPACFKRSLIIWNKYLKPRIQYEK